jgi:hypothetical protein
MDGSKHFAAAESSDATRVALRVDRDAVGLMKHASQLSHLIEWWLQGFASMNTMAAFRIGRRLERFRLAARLAEGRSSNQVRLTLEGLRDEVLRHEVPDQLRAELDAALRECERLKIAAEPPPTIVRRALTQEMPDSLPAPEPGAGPQAGQEPAPRRPRRPIGLLLLLVACAVLWWAAGGAHPLDALRALLAR